MSIATGNKVHKAVQHQIFHREALKMTVEQSEELIAACDAVLEEADKKEMVTLPSYLVQEAMAALKQQEEERIRECKTGIDQCNRQIQIIGH